MCLLGTHRPVNLLAPFFMPYYLAAVYWGVNRYFFILGERCRFHRQRYRVVLYIPVLIMRKRLRVRMGC